MLEDPDDQVPAFNALENVRRLDVAHIEVGFRPSERRMIVDQALQVISEIYVHLPLKRASRAIDPERRLRLLQMRIAEESGDEAPPEPLGLAGLGLEELLGTERDEPSGLDGLGLGELLASGDGEHGSALAGLGLDELVAPAPRGGVTADETMTDREFEDELMNVFASLHDLHTQYITPDPARRSTAFLPLLIEDCWEDNGFGRLEHRYIVSKFPRDSAGAIIKLRRANEHFVPGVRVTHWNGVPIERAVLRRAERSPGANPDAQHARGLESLTCRWLGTTSPPDEEYVVVTYHDGKESRTTTVRWFVGELPRDDTADPPRDDAFYRRAACIGLDPQTEMRRRLKYELYPTTRGAGPTDRTKPRDAPTLDTIESPSGEEVGYLRIFTFMVDDVDAFIDDIKRKLETVRDKAGLVIDLRGNPGGDILAGERLLALLCDQPAEQQLLQFRNTPTARRIAQSLGRDGGPGAASVLSSIATGLRSGAPYSSGSAIDTLPQRSEPAYAGRIVLIIDALCYSTAEVFAAGFQDARRGKILGTARNTGGGAGNSWEYEALQLFGGRDQFPRSPPGGRSAGPARAPRRSSSRCDG